MIILLQLQNKFFQIYKRILHIRKAKFEEAALIHENYKNNQLELEHESAHKNMEFSRNFIAVKQILNLFPFLQLCSELNMKVESNS
jgi:hypothetical protein